MKHLVKSNKLGAGSVRHHDDLRSALLGQLIVHDQIITTQAKAELLKAEMDGVRQPGVGC